MWVLFSVGWRAAAYVIDIYEHQCQMALSDFNIAFPDGVMRKVGRTEPSRSDSGGSVGIVIAPGMLHLFISL